MKILIRFATYQVEGEIYETATGKAIWEELPLKRNVNRWGSEIYFGVNTEAGLEEGAGSEVSVGDLAYWPNMPAFCIFFGPTPASSGDSPMAASAVNVFGRLLKVEPERLSHIPDGENVEVERVL